MSSDRPLLLRLRRECGSLNGARGSNRAHTFMFWHLLCDSLGHSREVELIVNSGPDK